VDRRRRGGLPADGLRGQAFAGSFRCERAGEQRQRKGDGGAEIRGRGRRNLVQGAQRQSAAEHAVERGDAEGQPPQPPAGGPLCALRLDRRHAAPERKHCLVRMVKHGRSGLFMFCSIDSATDRPCQVGVTEGRVSV
jgi:hypothetical protein